jgi:hypothetical protein
MWQGDAPGSYSKTADQVANEAIAALRDPQCRPN